MQTSYFYKEFKNEKAVSISGKSPVGFIGREYKKLAPKYWFFKKYKEDGDQEFYTKQYEKEVLSLLDPKKVLEDLGEDAILLCYEKEGFCHRHLVSKWLNENGIQCTEKP